MKIKFFLMFVLVTSLMVACNTQTSINKDAISFKSDRWEIKAKKSKVENYLGRESLYLEGGIAVLKDSHFTNGIIEYDIAINEKRGFIGGLWRFQDFKNFEKFYIRPHQSGNPDANQYTPVFNNLPGWQLYYGESYGAPVKYKFNEWMHIKIVVSSKKTEIYVMDMDKPALVVNNLKRETKKGKVGLRTENPMPGLQAGHYSNFTYKSIDKPELKGQYKDNAKTKIGTVTSWNVSNIFNKNLLKSKTKLSNKITKNLKWTKLNSENSGLVNLAIIGEKTKTQNTVFAKIIINSSKAQVKKINFGFSDEAKVFFNNNLIYGGNNTFRTRDYRYLGTINFFNELYLPLKKGKNELWIAVTEKFGGWGVQAKFENLNDITLK